MKVPYSWIRDLVDVPATAEEIGRKMSLRGLALEGLEAVDGDTVLDFDVTANRPDCMSVVGIAREIAAVYGLPLNLAGRSARSDDGGAEAPPYERGVTIPVTIDEPELCARYVGAVADVSVGPSPAWMQTRLAACGVRPISNIVDITNYVLLELGQPMHAFDFARLAGPEIRVRRARKGERMTTLDGKARTLGEDMLVIADAERAQAIGGVMGGADSEVSASSTRIVFEAAWFKPTSVRATSKALGLRTEASMRFERGMDLSAPARAMARACELLTVIGAGRLLGAFTDAYPRPWVPREIVLPRHQVTGLLGMPVSDSDVVRILAALGFIARPSETGWMVAAPGWRVDVQRPVDLIEEVGRHHGFEHLPATFPGVEQAPAPSDPRIARDTRVRQSLIGMGFSEAISFAFIEEAAAAPFTPAGQPKVALANPLSEKFAVMRPSLLPGLVDAVSHNRRHGRPDVRLFEIGTRFSPAGESRGAAMAWTGLATPDHWSGGRRGVDFFDLKGAVEQVASLHGLALSFADIDLPYLSAGQAAAVSVDGETIGIVGRLADPVAAARDLPAGEAVYVAELNLDRLTAHATTASLRATPLARFPSVVRDLSILVDETLSAETVRGTIRAAAPSTLVQVREFDRYQGKGVPDGQVSLSLRLTFQAVDRTLTDDEVQAGMQGIVAALAATLKAVQR